MDTLSCGRANNHLLAILLRDSVTKLEGPCKLKPQAIWTYVTFFYNKSNADFFPLNVSSPEGSPSCYVMQERNRLLGMGK